MAYLPKNLIDRICIICGTTFKARPYQIKIGNGRFCSRTCKGLGQPREPLEVRFWKNVDKSNGTNACWPWTGYCNDDGYGIIGIGAQRTESTHRVGYRLQIGPISPGKQVLHRCDNPPCCNGLHLFTGTQPENISDMIAKGRHVVPTGGRCGSAKLSEEQIRLIHLERSNGTSVKELAHRFHVHQNSIYNILNNVTWKHLDL